MKNYEYSPIVITGPSGAGKSELIDFVEKENPLFLEASGSTTRKKRLNETGRMNFISRNEFEELIKSNQLIEYCTYNGNYYGVAKNEFEKLQNYFLMFNVGYSSAKVIKKLHNESFMIYLLPPTKDELIKRLGDRDFERYRLGYEETIMNAFKYEYLLISYTDNLLDTYNDLLDIVYEKSESQQMKLTLAKNKDFINNFYK